MTMQVNLLREAAEEWPQLALPDAQRARLRAGGADYVADFINLSEEMQLLAAVDKGVWSNDLQRRVQHYGYRYDYKSRGINAAASALPLWAEKIRRRLLLRGIFPALPEQLIVNEYQPGQGIAPHTDRDCFGEVVASLSLGGDCLMQIAPRAQAGDAFEIVLKRRSLLILQGESRNQWQHGIAPRKTDAQNGCKIPRVRRVSLTFRNVV